MFNQFTILTEHLNFLESSDPLIISEGLNEIEDNFEPDGYNFQMLYLYYLYLDVKNADLKLIKSGLSLENDIITKNLKYVEMTGEDLERELKIVNKEKMELLDENKKLEQAISKFMFFDARTQTAGSDLQISISQSKSAPNKRNSISTISMLKNPKDMLKEKEKKVKELKAGLSRMEKLLDDAKIHYEDKKEKNEICIKENEELSQNAKQKLASIDQLKSEIAEMKNKIESKSSKTKDKGIFGFVKNFFNK